MNNRVMVMGVLVSFSTSTIINGYYGMMNVSQGKYEDYLENIDYKKVKEALTLRETGWDITNERHK